MFAKDLIEVHKICEDAYECFKQERMTMDSQDTKFYEQITEMKLKTFADIGKKSNSLCNRKEVLLKADKRPSGQMILVAKAGDCTR